MTTPKRSPGRPRLDPEDRSVDVHLKMAARAYDRAYEQARRERVSVPELIRRAVARTLRADRREE